MQEIDVLCSETSQLIENHDKIAELSAVHYNLGKTLEDVENIMALPNEAAMAEELLRDDLNLLQVCLPSTPSSSQKDFEIGDASLGWTNVRRHHFGSSHAHHMSITCLWLQHLERSPQ